jgi:hypothetical protein
MNYFPFCINDAARPHYFHFGKLFGGPRIGGVRKVISGRGFSRNSLFG